MEKTEMMEFDKNKILTVVTADQAKVGSMGHFSNYIPTLEGYVTRGCKPDKLMRVSLNTIYPFYDGHNYYSLFYPAPEPTYRPFHDDELNDIVGKVVVQNHTGNAMLIIKVVDSETGKVVSLGGSQKRNAQQLMEGWTFKGGHPCGVKVWEATK